MIRILDKVIIVLLALSGALCFAFAWWLDLPDVSGKLRFLGFYLLFLGWLYGWLVRPRKKDPR